MNAPARIGRYEIVRRLSTSMTDVFLAVDTVENRKAALKAIQLESADTATRMVLEAERRGASIQRELQVLDPRVIEIYDFGEADGYFYVAMQYVEGRNLAEVLAAENAIDPYRAATVALEICEQLAKFHTWQSTVVHGDIKPSNIHLGRNDTVRLLDFGIAKTLRADKDATNHNFGSPTYCSPERLTRSEVDAQSDLWAVGATLYEMLAGVPAYQAENTRKLEGLIRSGKPPRALPASCPRSLRAIVTKALSPQAQRRYGSAREFQEDLQAFLEHRPTVAETERRGLWNANATLDAARHYFRKATRTVRRAGALVAMGSSVAWFAGGMALWIGGSYAVQMLQANRTPAVASAPDLMIPMLYVGAADKVIEAYRISSDPSLHDFDWQKAEVCLARAVELGEADDRTLGKLALSRGYALLERLTGGQYSDAGAGQMRARARDLFENAALKLPRDPAPHIALARVYVYSLPSVEMAMREFEAAERLGAQLGPREIEQEGDAYRLRAEQEARDEEWKQAAADEQVSRRLYQRIGGFDQADSHIAELARIHPPTVRKAKTRRTYRWR